MTYESEATLEKRLIQLLTSNGYEQVKIPDEEALLKNFRRQVNKHNEQVLYHLADNGTMAVVLPHGVLFRGAAEGTIRKVLIDNYNYLDAVIGLPANIFFGTSIPTCILIFKKCLEHDKDILFIDASNEFEKGKNQNRLSDAHVSKIVDTYKNRETIDKYSYVAPLTEVAENDFNLNIPRYVDTFEEEPDIDLHAVHHQLQAIDREIVERNAVLDQYFEELEVTWHE